MKPKVVLLKQPKWERVYDSKGNPIRGFLRHRRTGIIYYRESFKRLGIPDLFITTGHSGLGKARTAAQVLVQRHKNQHLGIDDSSVFLRRRGHTFGSAAEDVLKRLTPTKRATTQENHRYYIGELITEWGEKDLNAITARDFEGWIERLRRTRSRKTFSDYAKNMNLVMRHAYNERLCSHLIRFKNPDQNRKKAGRVFTDAEISALWAEMNDETRDQFALCYTCMMRLREALHLKWEQVNLKTGIVALSADDVKTGSKTGRGRSFQLSAEAWSRLQARSLKRNKASPYVFPSPENPAKPIHQNKTAWRLAKERAGITGRARWHDLRHSAISKALLEKRVEPIQVSEYAGVSLRTIQAVYLHSQAEHTHGVAAAISIERRERAVNGEMTQKQSNKNHSRKGVGKR